MVRIFPILFSSAIIFFAQSAVGESEKDLESRIWQAREAQLFDLENKVVRMMQENPQSSYAHYLLSHLYIEKFSYSPGDLSLLKQSSELAQQAAELESKSDYGVVATCEILDITGQSKKALTLLKQAMGSGVNVSWRSYFMLGKLSAEEASFEKILAYYRQALGFKESKQSIIVPYVIASLKSQYADKTNELEKKIVEWNNHFPNVLFLEALASVMITKENYKNARKVYQLILKEHPERVETQINLAILRINFLNEQNLGLKDLKAILKKSKESISEEFLALVYSNIAMAYLDQKKYELAQEYFVRVHTHANEEYALSLAQGAYSKHKAHAKFVSFLNYITSEVGGSGLSYALLGEAYSDQLNDPDLAIDAYKNAILIDDKVSYYYNGLGLAYHKKSEYQTAMSHFSKAVKVDPSDAVARYNLACMYSRLGKIQDALASIQEAFALSPELMQTAQSDPDLQNIRSLQAYKSIISDVSSIDEDIQDILSH